MWTHRRQLEQLLQQVTTLSVSHEQIKLCHGEKDCHVMEQLRGDIASSRPMLTKGCCKGNNYEQNLSLDFPDEPENNRRNV